LITTLTQLQSNGLSGAAAYGSDLQDPGRKGEVLAILVWRAFVEVA